MSKLTLTVKRISRALAGETVNENFLWHLRHYSQGRVTCKRKSKKSHESSHCELVQTAKSFPESILHRILSSCLSLLPSRGRRFSFHLPPTAPAQGELESQIRNSVKFRRTYIFASEYVHEIFSVYKNSYLTHSGVARAPTTYGLPVYLHAPVIKRLTERLIRNGWSRSSSCINKAYWLSLKTSGRSKRENEWPVSHKINEMNPRSEFSWISLYPPLPPPPPSLASPRFWHHEIFPTKFYVLIFNALLISQFFQ